MPLDTPIESEACKRARSSAEAVKVNGSARAAGGLGERGMTITRRNKGV
jgi:hypothetical protein